jgi:hypothetical protein
MSNKNNARVAELVIYCEKLNSNYIINVDDVEFYSWIKECEFHRNHGEIHLSIRECPACGKIHDIILKSW